MRAYVLPDARLAKHAGRFVWLSIHTEQTKKQGDRAALAATLEEALAYSNQLPDSQRDERIAAALRSRLGAFQGK